VDLRGRGVRRAVFGVVVAALVVPVVVLLFVGRGGSTRPRAAAPIKGTDLSGRHVSLDQFRGRPVLVNFWASWCDPCRAEFPLIREYSHAHPDVAVLGVDFMDARDNAAAFVREMQADWPSVVDPDGTIGRRFGIVGLPVTVAVDRQGRVTARHIGQLHPGDIEKLLAV